MRRRKSIAAGLKESEGKIITPRKQIRGNRAREAFAGEMQNGWHYVLEHVTLTQRLITPAELVTHRYPLADPKRGLVVMHGGGSAALEY